MTPAAQFRQKIKENLTVQTSIEQAEQEHSYVFDRNAHFGTTEEWEAIVCDWQEFKAAFALGDQIWEFDTVSESRGFCAGEEGLVILRDGKVVTWFITCVVG